MASRILGEDINSLSTNTFFSLVGDKLDGQTTPYCHRYVLNFEYLNLNRPTCKVCGVDMDLFLKKLGGSGWSKRLSTEAAFPEMDLGSPSIWVDSTGQHIGLNKTELRRTGHTCFVKIKK